MSGLKFEDLKPGMKVEYLKTDSYQRNKTWVPAEIVYIIYEPADRIRICVKHSQTWSSYVTPEEVPSFLRPPTDEKKVERLEARIAELEALLKSAEAHVETLERTNKNWQSTMNETRLAAGAEFGQDIREVVRCLAEYKSKFLAARAALA